MIDVSPNTSLDKFYSFDASLDSWFNELTTTAMTAGKGYIIRGPESFSNTVTAYHEAVFDGVPNNGLVSIPIGMTDTSNLIGNPYPSAIDANLFINENNGILDGTIYFWTHNTAISNNLYTSDDYAVYNSLGGVGTSASLSSGVNNTMPDGKIASAQAFFVTAINGGGIAKFNNSMRLIGQNSSFFKLNTIKKAKTKEIEKHRIWLDLYNNEGAFKQILLGYATGATDDFDNSFDGESFNGNEYLDFYSIIQDKNLAIQGRALPFKETDEVRLGFTTTIAGAFTIKIDQVDELLALQNVFVEDKSNNRIVNLKNENYTFNTVSGSFNDRFVLRFTEKNLALNELEKDKESVLVFNESKQLQVNSTKEFIDEILIYDLAGRKIYERNNINDIDFSLLDLVSNHQVLLINIILQNGHSVVRKVVY
ncbi:T9SS sorting signal type C domain-containing protein [Flavobacterium sp. LB3R33]|uniref:T9SS sorting signal type C domain-containing protein n=1 Tax=Flavobacterium sp. LB3R33 TaxID=3401721 RepID=UPI003AAA6776